MVKSKSSFFKIITCGSDSADKDDLVEPLESKRSTDKRGWSFRKRSARHRVVLSNTMIAESPSISNKESQVSTSTNFHAQTNLTSEKISITDWKTDYPLSGVANSNAPGPLSTTKNECKTDPLISTESTHGIDSLISKANVNKVDHNLEESSAVVIQTAIRGYLARRTLLKLRNVIKLQAAVRGHLVRSKAVGTLRCVHAITKMQALVRARHARQSLQGLAIEEKPDEHGRYSSVKPLGKENPGTKANINYSSTKKLLSNAFARQLMQSTPKSKQINIKCDPLKPDSSWNWLERWVSVSSLDSVETKKPQISPEYEENEGRTEDAASELGPEIRGEACSFSTDMNSNSTRAATSVGNEESLITCDADNFVFHARRRTSSSANDMQQPCIADPDSTNSHESSSKIGTSQSEMLSIAPSQTLSTFKPVADNEQPKHSTDASCRSISSTRDVGVESNVDRLSSADSRTKTKEPSLTENSISNETRVQVADSECGSLLSITSTLDSPDRSEDGGIDIEQEPEFIEKMTSELNVTTDNVASGEDLDVQPKNDISVPQSKSSTPASIQPESNEDANGESDLSLSVDPQKVEWLPERSASDVQPQLDSVTEQQSYRSSPEGSPRSHVAVPESHGTPLSQVSVNAKRSKLDKSGATQSRKYQTPSKQSPSNQNHDSGSRSIEQLPNDPKSGKRRNSFGSAKSNHLDQEPRDSSSSLPSYMQATESARAKAHANLSPRSSPDVQDKDIYIKKRHSLPGTNGTQGSPRIQRSTSQAQPGAKGSSTNSPHEKKWIR